MCGIFGFVSDSPSKENLELFKDLCTLSSIRGTDSTGIAVVSGDKIVIDKEAISSPKFIDKKLPEYESRIKKSNITIGHTRKWTMGKPSDNNNNHPIVSDSWVMIHNGICSSMDRIKDYKYRGEVDSEILLSYVEKYGVEKGLSYLSGYAATALLNFKEPNNLYLWRHNEDILLGYDKEKSTLFFGSSKDIMETGLANELLLFSSFQIRELPENTLYQISHSPLCIEEIAEIEIKKPHSSWYNRVKKHCSDYSGMDYDYGGNTMASTKKTYVWSKELGMMIPIEDKNEEENKGEEKEDKNLPATITNKYYFTKQSIDFHNWIRIGKFFISCDRLLVKVWDKDKRTHFIMLFEDALKEKIIDSSECSV